jgi:hypothetical protein
MDDFLLREYLPIIRQFPDKEVQRSLLRESARTLVRVKDPSRKPPSAPVSDTLPTALELLAGPFCDLSFDRLDLSPSGIDTLYLAFCGQGVAVPGTPYKLRHSVMSLITFVELASGHEVELPANWRVAVRSRRWIGKKVPADGLDLSQYEDKGDGYLLREAKCASGLFVGQEYEPDGSPFEGLLTMRHPINTTTRKSTVRRVLPFSRPNCTIKYQIPRIARQLIPCQEASPRRHSFGLIDHPKVVMRGRKLPRDRI